MYYGLAWPGGNPHLWQFLVQPQRQGNYPPLRLCKETMKQSVCDWTQDWWLRNDADIIGHLQSNYGETLRWLTPTIMRLFTIFKTHPSPGGYKGKCTQETLYVTTQNDMLMSSFPFLPFIHSARDEVSNHTCHTPMGKTIIIPNIHYSNTFPNSMSISTGNTMGCPHHPHPPPHPPTFHPLISPCPNHYWQNPWHKVTPRDPNERCYIFAWLVNLQHFEFHYDF